MTRWVLLRGLTREAGHWGGFADALRERSGATVLPLDLPGNGSRWRERSPLSVRALAEDCRAQVGAGPGPTVLLAMSLGAMVALEWCRAAPGELAGCVLVNTSAGGASPFWQRLQPRNYAALLRLAGARDAQAREARVLAMTSAAPQRQPALAADWAALARRHPVAAPNAVRQLWAAAAYRVPRRPPSVPLLLLASAQDRLVAPACSARLAARWQVPLQQHPWAGHDLPLDDPAWVIDQALAWWGRVDGGV